MIDKVKEEIKYLLIPDIHCREFWKEPVKDVLANADAKIVCFGDYLDGYAHEWTVDDDYQTRGIANFRELIGLKKDHPERIVLLIGNHDCGYAIGRYTCDCRTDTKHYDEIRNLFLENWDLFQLAYEMTINGKHFICSHAGINKKFATDCFGEYANEANVVEKFNRAWIEKNEAVFDRLGQYSYYRGWGGQDYGSLVWADLREWACNPDDKNEAYGNAIVGHTQLEKNIVFLDNITCIDARRAIYADNDGNLHEYATGELLTN